MRTLAALGFMIVALGLGLYALQLSLFGLGPDLSAAQALVVKSIMFHAAFAGLFSLAAMTAATGWLRLAGLVPLAVVGRVAWEIQRVWLHVFP